MTVSDRGVCPPAVLVLWFQERCQGRLRRRFAMASATLDTTPETTFFAAVGWAGKTGTQTLNICATTHKLPRLGGGPTAHACVAARGPIPANTGKGFPGKTPGRPGKPFTPITTARRANRTIPTPSETAADQAERLDRMFA